MASLASPRSVCSNEAFAALVRSVQPTAIRICRRYGVPPQDSEDLMQQALIALIDARDKVEDPKAWLAGTLRNHCLMYWRRRRRRLYNAVDTAILEELADPAPPDQDGIDLSHDLSQALGQLPNRCRSVLELRYGLGCRPKETAERLGYQCSSIYKILERCLAALSRSLTAKGLGNTQNGAGATTQCQLAPRD